MPDDASIRDPFDDFEEDMAGLRVAPDAYETTTDGWGEGQFDYNQAAYGEPDISEPVENLWKDYQEKDEPVKRQDDEIVCPLHGPTCSRGICTTYKRIQKQREFAKLASEREHTVVERRWNQKSGDSGMFVDMIEGVNASLLFLSYRQI